VIPPVIHEQDCHPFKFWFNGEIQEGMVYRNELFYRLQTATEAHRAKLYQRACQLAQQEVAHEPTVVVTASEQAYSIWLSLRSANLCQSNPLQLIKVEDCPEV